MLFSKAHGRAVDQRSNEVVDKRQEGRPATGDIGAGLVLAELEAKVRR